MPITSTIPTRWHELLRARLGSRIGFAGAACSLVAVFAASASPIPLYELYRRTDGLSHADLSLTAVAYFVAVMAALGRALDQAALDQSARTLQQRDRPPH